MIRKERRLFCFMRHAHLFLIVSDRIKFTPAFTSTRQTEAYRTVVEIPYNMQSLYASLDVRASSVGVKESSRGSGLSSDVWFERVVCNWLCG